MPFRVPTTQPPTLLNATTVITLPVAPRITFRQALARFVGRDIEGAQVLVVEPSIEQRDFVRVDVVQHVVTGSQVPVVV